MGTHIMDAQGVDCGNNSGKPLARQSSIYGLTLDEVQNQLGDLGKPLRSMNLDELLKCVWTAESNLSVGGSAAVVAHQSLLQRQPSLPLAESLSKKTVDEVWRDIQQEHYQNGNQEICMTEKQRTLGAMTLEDFLTKAGVVADGVLEKTNNGTFAVSAEQSASQQFPPTLQGKWTECQQPQFENAQQKMIDVYMSGPPMSQPIPMGAARTVMDAESQMSVASAVIGALSDPQGSTRKRMVPEDRVEKSVERRQKRMIKNRESAARSRARKQAYTNQLEEKISLLKEENERLRNRKELEKKLHSCATPSVPKYQLRRTSSWPL